MSNKVVLVVPEAPPATTANAPAERRIAKDELRLGMLDNSKGNADHLLRFIAEGVQAGLAVKSVLALRKGSVSLPAPREMLDALEREADLVVTAMAD